MKTLSVTIAIIAVLVGVSCSEPETETITAAVPQNVQPDAQRHLFAPIIPDIQGKQKVFYNDNLFKIKLTRTSAATSAAILASDEPIAKIFLTVGHNYKKVIDSYDRFGLAQYAMLHLIEFNSGVAPRQFHSMTEIEEAETAAEITMSNTELIYQVAPL